MGFVLPLHGHTSREGQPVQLGLAFPPLPGSTGKLRALYGFLGRHEALLGAVTLFLYCLLF